MASVVRDQLVVSSVEFGEVVFTIMSWFQPLNPPHSPVPTSSQEQIVVDSPTVCEAPVGSIDVSPDYDRMVQILPLESQVSLLSSVQLSPNRVREDFNYDTLDVFPVF